MAERRRQILDAAAACIARDGLAGFSTTALCKEAGISTGALYRHFESREEILIGLTEREAHGRRAHLSAESYVEFRSALIALLAPLATEEGKSLARLDLQMASAAAVMPGVAEIVRPMLIGTYLTTALQQLQRAGELRPESDPATLAAILESVVAGQIYLLAVSGQRAPDPAEVIDAILGPHAVGTPA